MSDQISEDILDPELSLSEHTLNALKEFLSENSRRFDSEEEINNGHIEENWQLSQFWYTEETADYLSNEIINALNLSTDDSCDETSGVTNRSIACISCPTLFNSLYKKLNKCHKYSINLVLLEFDKRFQTKYASNYVFYDYNNPIDDTIKEKFNELSFDAVIADPPFLSEECIRKTSQTIKYLAKDKVLVCTGATMRHFIQQYLQLEECHHFEPQHNRKLGNEFKCFSNFELRLINDK